MNRLILYIGLLVYTLALSRLLLLLLEAAVWVPRLERDDRLSSVGKGPFN